jgi:hypothetical protein
LAGQFRNTQTDMGRMALMVDYTTCPPNAAAACIVRILARSAKAGASEEGWSARLFDATELSLTTDRVLQLPAISRPHVQTLLKELEECQVLNAAVARDSRPPRLWGALTYRLQQELEALQGSLRSGAEPLSLFLFSSAERFFTPVPAFGRPGEPVAGRRASQQEQDPESFPSALHDLLKDGMVRLVWIHTSTAPPAPSLVRTLASARVALVHLDLLLNRELCGALQDCLSLDP